MMHKHKLVLVGVHRPERPLSMWHGGLILLSCAITSGISLISHGLMHTMHACPVYTHKHTHTR